tara:strand:+ start:235 stop:1581 length:1347 start_codon:yes stop_codon:yes gene_type:complete
MIEFQKTILTNLEIKGIGLHTGEKSKIKIKPAKENSGIIFLRVDFKKPVEIKATIENVIDCNRGTTIGIGAVKIFTIEHLMSALSGLGIDNVLIEIDNIEPPILDGSSKGFVDEILKVGTKKLPKLKKYIKIIEPITYSNHTNNVNIEIRPSNTFSVQFDGDFQYGNIGQQSFTFDSHEDYIKEVSMSRTFCSLNELIYLKNEGLIKGGNIDNALVFLDENQNQDEIGKVKKAFNIDISMVNKTLILNDKKLRYENEPARHKVLDLIGDFSLLGYSIIGHIHSHGGGHQSNIEVVKMVNNLIKDKFIFNKDEIKKIIPHREPFLLIDNIIARTDKYVSAIKYINPEEYFFEGHFPNNPIMPGVLIVESMAQASCFLSINSNNFDAGKIMLLSSIKSSKFISKVLPRDILFIEVELLKYKLGTAFIKGSVKVNNKVVAKAEFMATMSSK